MSFLDKRTDKKPADYQQELIETHYQEVENMYRQMRGWRHDYRNHIQAMKAYAASVSWMYRQSSFHPLRAFFFITRMTRPMTFFCWILRWVGKMACLSRVRCAGKIRRYRLYL